MKRKEKTKLENLTEELADFMLNWYARKVKEEYHLKDQFNQLARAATSIGANLAEAKFAQSDADYVSKLSIARKESSECRFWIQRMVHMQAFTYEEWELVEAKVEAIINMLTATINKVKSV